MKIFVSIASARLLPQMGEMLRFCDLFSLYCIFFSCTHPGHTHGWISTVYGSNDVLPPKEVPFGGIDDIKIRLGSKIPPNPSKNGVVRQFQAKMPEYRSLNISKNLKGST